MRNLLALLAIVFAMFVCANAVPTPQQKRSKRQTGYEHNFFFFYKFNSMSHR
jgi:hypothetical protein